MKLSHTIKKALPCGGSAEFCLSVSADEVLQPRQHTRLICDINVMDSSGNVLGRYRNWFGGPSTPYSDAAYSSFINRFVSDPSWREQYRVANFELIGDAQRSISVRALENNRIAVFNLFRCDTGTKDAEYISDINVFDIHENILLASYRRTFDEQSINSAHYINFMNKFARDPIYRQNFLVKVSGAPVL